MILFASSSTRSGTRQRRCSRARRFILRSPRRSSPTPTIETTLAIYTHLDGIEDMRAAVAKLDFCPLAERAPAPVVPLRKEPTFAANLLPAAFSPKAEAPDRPDKIRKIRGLQKSGRLDLNQRPLAPQGPPCLRTRSHREARRRKLAFSLHSPASQFRTPSHPSHRSGAVVLQVLQNAGPLWLTPAEVAARLRVCRATVYALCARGALGHVRVGLYVRIAPQDLAAYVASSRGGIAGA